MQPNPIDTWVRFHDTVGFFVIVSFLDWANFIFSPHYPFLPFPTIDGVNGLNYQNKLDYSAVQQNEARQQPTQKAENIDLTAFGHVRLLELLIAMRIREQLSLSHFIHRPCTPLYCLFTASERNMTVETFYQKV